MYLYQLVAILLIVLSIREIKMHKSSVSLFNFMYFLMTIMATFRYGQLGDYFGYMYLYNFPSSMMAKDPGFGLLIVLSNALGLDYTVFVSFLSFLCMALAYRFFSTICHYSFLALFVFYSFLFIYGAMAGFRQGLCLSLLVNVYTLLIERKYKLFYVYVLLGCFIHLSFIIAFLMPFIINIKFFHRKEVWFLILFCTFIAFIGIRFSVLLPSFIVSRLYNENGETSDAGFLQIALRFSILLPVLLYNAKEKSDAYYAKSLTIFGYCMFCLLSSDTLVAGRLEYYFRIFICVFLSYIIYKETKLNLYMMKPFLFFLLFVHIVVLYKNLDFCIDNGNYKPHIHVYNLPYVSIFNPNDIDNYSTIRYDNSRLMVEP